MSIDIGQDQETAMTEPRSRSAPPSPRDWTTSSLGERVEHVCALRGWSLNKLGEEASLASGVVSRLARREATVAGAPDTLARVADAAGVNVLWLMLGRGPVERIEHATGALRSHPGWPAALAEAQKWQRGIPDEFWALAGETVFPAPPPHDWQLVVGIVRELYSAHQRWLETTDPPEGPPGSAPSAARPRSGVRKR